MNRSWTITALVVVLGIACQKASQAKMEESPPDTPDVKALVLKECIDHGVSSGEATPEQLAAYCADFPKPPEKVTRRDGLELLRSKTDKMESITWYQDPTSNQVLGKYVRLYFGVRGDTVNPLRMQVQYEGDDWVFAKHLKFDVDDRIFDVETNASSWRREVGGGSVWERYDKAMIFDTELLAALANAKSATVRFSGDRYSDFKIPRTQLKAIHDVYWIWRATTDPADSEAAEILETSLKVTAAAKRKASLQKAREQRELEEFYKDTSAEAGDQE